MYLYDIGYFTEEESHYWQLVHKEKYTENELIQIVSDIMIEIIEHICGKTHSILVEEATGYDMIYLGEDGVWVSYLMESSAFHRLLGQKGFNDIEFQASVDFDGWHLLPADRDAWGVDSSTNRLEKLMFGKLKRKNITYKVLGKREYAGVTKDEWGFSKEDKK